MNTNDIIELGTVSCEEVPFDPIEQAKFEAAERQRFINGDQWMVNTNNDHEDGDMTDTPLGIEMGDGTDNDDNMTDVEADADTLASAGWGTDEDYDEDYDEEYDEDYGYFGDGE